MFLLLFKILKYAICGKLYQLIICINNLTTKVEILADIVIGKNSSLIEYENAWSTWYTEFKNKLALVNNIRFL